MVALADGVAGLVLVEPVGMRAVSRRLAVGIVTILVRRLPGAVGACACRRTVGEPRPLGLLVRRDRALAGLQELHRAGRDRAARLDGHADLAAFGAGDGGRTF